MMRGRIFGLLTLVFISPLLFAQASQRGTGTPTTGAGAPPSPVQGPLQPTVLDRVKFLTGQVIIDDGSPLPARAEIERICDGAMQRAATTDAQGHFRVDLMRASLNSADADYNASVGGARTASPGATAASNATSMNCLLRAKLDGFRSDTLVLTGRLTENNVGIIVLHRVGKVEGTTVSVTSLRAPKDAKKALEQAQKAAAKQKFDDEQQALEKAVGVFPEYAQAWLDLGKSYRRARRDQDAEKAFERALAADAKFIPPYFELASLAAQSTQWQRVVDLTEKALALDPYDFPMVYFYNSIAYYNLHEMDKAEKSARAARRLDSQNQIPRIDLLLGRILERRQDYSGAAEQLRLFLKYAPAGPEAELVKTELANVESRLPAKKP